jgi:hypothetical protein
MMSRNDARPTGEETISKTQEQPERNAESNTTAQGESCGGDLDTGDNWVQREDLERGDSER